MFGDHVGGIPVGPVFITLSSVAGFVLSMGDGGAAHGGGQISDRGEAGDSGVDAAGEAGGDLLEEPAVAVGVFEGGEGAIARVRGIGTGDANAAEDVRLVGAGVFV